MVCDPPAAGAATVEDGSGSTHEITVTAIDAPPAGPRGAIAVIVVLPASRAASVAVSDVAGVSEAAFALDEDQLMVAPGTGRPAASSGVAEIVCVPSTKRVVAGTFSAIEL